MNEYIWVLDYSTGHVYRYTNHDGLCNEDNSDIEDFIVTQGHKLSNINWMSCDSENANLE